MAQFWRHLVVADADERHAKRTAELLRTYGADDELIQAGLLHDSEKPRNARIWHRVASTLLELFAPRVRARLATGDDTLARYLDHARRSADRARAEGRSDRVVRLIARHHDTPVTDDERLLARADREALP